MDPSFLQNRENIKSKFGLSNEEKKVKFLNKQDTITIDRNILACLPSLKNDYLSNSYTYNIVDIVNSENANFKTDKLIHICIYKVVTHKRNIPFLLYLLNKASDNMLYFPHFYTTKKVKDELDDKINILYGNYLSQPHYQGFRETDHNIYFFYMDETKNRISLNNYNTNWWWTSIFEIMNNHMVLNFKIDRLVYSIFYKEPLLSVLFNNNNKVDIPLIGYFGGYKNYIDFIANFGIPKQSPFSNLGPYYYFSTYKGAGRWAIWSSLRKETFVEDEEITRNEYGVFKKGGLVRFAVFGNNIRYFLNRDSDKEDQSDISKEQAEKKPFVKATLKIRDVDGVWAIDHDLAYIGSTFIDYEGNKYKGRVLDIQWAARDYYQIVPLTYHYINTDEYHSIQDPEKAKNMPYEYTDYDIE